MSEPLDSAQGSLALLGELRRLQLRALVLVSRAQAAHRRALKSFENTKAPVAAGAGKGDQGK